MKTLPTVDLIVLNWNARAYLDTCLHTLLAQDYPVRRIIVVDNASTDDSVAHVRANFPGVHVIVSETNRGFSGGNNLGLTHSDAEIAVLVNPDVEAPPTWLRALVTPMTVDADIGIAGCLLYESDGTIQHAGGMVVSPIGLTEHRGRGTQDVDAYAAVSDVDYVIGAAMAIRREVVDRIGGLDETFFLYYEDVDFCFRARAAGYRVIYVPTPPAVHHESVTTDKASQFYLEQLHTSRWRFLVKHTPFPALVTTTVEAERRWTAMRSLREQRAFVRAYRRVLQELPRLWPLRPRTASAAATHGDRGETMEQSETAPTPEAQQNAVAVQLAALAAAAQAAQTSSFRQATAALSQERQMAQAHTLETLQRAAYVTEKPFTSQAPVVGPLIAWLRNAWNMIATTWYVRPLLQQQNDYNALVYAKLEELVEFQREMYTMVRETHALLAAINERMIDDDRDVTELALQVGKTRAALLQLDEHLSGHPPDQPA